MKRVKASNVSNNVIRRLPRYLRKLDDLNESGVERISSKELGEQLGLTPSQIRQDFSCFGEFGQQGYGYNVLALREQIAGILAMDRGFHLAAAFDIKPHLIGTEFQGVKIYGMDELTAYIRENRVDVAVLAVPKEAAIPVTKLLTDSGIEAIWNFTNVELTEPNSRTIVENIHFSDSLLALSYFVAERKDENEARAAKAER